MGYPFQTVGKQRPGTGYIQTNEPLSTRTVQCTRIDHQLLFLLQAQGRGIRADTRCSAIYPDQIGSLEWQHRILR